MAGQDELVRPGFAGGVGDMEHGGEVRIREDADPTFAVSDKDLFPAPAKGDLVGLNGLLVRCKRRSLSW